MHLRHHSDALKLNGRATDSRMTDIKRRFTGCSELVGRRKRVCAVLDCLRRLQVEDPLM